MEASESKFSFYNPPVGRVNYVKEADLYGIYRYIVDPKYAKRQTDTLRTIISDDERKRFKANNFAYCLFSGTFGTNRKNDGLQQHSGLLCLDFDHMDDAGQLTASRSALLNDQYFETLLLFVSPSGNGLKWVIPIGNEFLPIGAPDATRESCVGESEGRGRFKGSGGASPREPRAVREAHEQWYTGVSNYLRATYELQADPACKNVARACFLPHDPDCYIAPRLHRELAPMVAENPCVLDLMNQLCATNIKIENNESDQ